MDFRVLSIAMGIMAGTAGIANSGYGLYKNVVVKPAQNAEYNLSLMSEMPLVAETIEIQPVSDLALRVEVTVKVFKTGDILVESGSRRQYIPFKLSENTVAMNGLISAAFANEIVRNDGVVYEVKVQRYLEEAKSLADNKIQRVRTYEDGSVETSIIDIRSNKVLETTNTKTSLTDAQRKAITASPYKKKVFVPIQPAGK